MTFFRRIFGQKVEKKVMGPIECVVENNFKKISPKQVLNLNTVSLQRLLQSQLRFKTRAKLNVDAFIFGQNDKLFWMLIVHK